MVSFIFQSVVGRYDLREVLRPGETVNWYATRYRRDMKPGCAVFFWMGGDVALRGLYGWGRITSKPYREPGWSAHGVDVQYVERFANFVPADEFKRDRILKRMLLLRAPQATNFLLSAQEEEALLKLLRSRGLSAFSVGPS